MSALTLGPGSGHGVAATITLHEPAQRKVFIEVLAGSRGSLSTFKVVLNALESLKADQPFMLTFAQTYIPLWGFNISGIDDFLEQPVDCHWSKRSVFAILWEMRITLQKALNLCLRYEVPGRISFERLPHGRSQRLIWHQYFPAADVCGNVAITNRGAEDPEAAFDSGLHFLHDLAAVLFALKLTLRGDNRLDELAFRRVFELEVQALDGRPALRKLAPELQVKLCITGKALEIIEDDHIRLALLRFQIAEQRDHAGAAHKITAAADIIRKDGFNFVALLISVGAAALFLALKAATFDLLLRAGHAAIDHCVSCQRLDIVFFVHFCLQTGPLSGP